MIQGRGRYGAKEMAADLEVSERTIFRDLNVLELAGVPWFYDQQDRNYQVRPGYNFPAVNLSDDELIGQATAATITSAPGLDVTRGAGPTTMKLRSTSREDAAQLLREVEDVTSVLGLKLAEHGKHHEIIRTAQWALIRSTRLSGAYLSPYDSRTKRLLLHPYRLCLVKQAWYLIARPEGADQPRTYRMARFMTLRSLDEPASVPPDFDLASYFGNAWGVYRRDRSHDVELRFTPSAAPLVTETPWHSTQKVRRHPDGGVTLSFRVDGLREILHWVLGWSGRVQVIEPEELRLMVVDELRRSIELNQRPGDP
jgi:predicted DNA-binding transcriptional regulator YafY